MVLTANNKNPTKLLKLNLLDAKFRASADMKNKTPQNIYNTMCNLLVGEHWPLVWFGAQFVVSNRLRVLLKKVQ
jgi:hypothetical protein